MGAEEAGHVGGEVKSHELRGSTQIKMNVLI